MVEKNYILIWSKIIASDRRKYYIVLWSKILYRCVVGVLYCPLVGRLGKSEFVADASDV